MDAAASFKYIFINIEQWIYYYLDLTPDYRVHIPCGRLCQKDPCFGNGALQSNYPRVR